LHRVSEKIFRAVANGAAFFAAAKRKKAADFSAAFFDQLLISSRISATAMD